MVRVDRPMKALYMHIQSLIRENCLSSHSCHFVKTKKMNQTPSCICSMCLHCIAKYEIAPSKTLVEVDSPYDYNSISINLYKKPFGTTKENHFNRIGS